MQTLRHLFARATFITLLSLTGGCTAPLVANVRNEAEVGAPAWPAPPSPTRIRYSHSFSGPGDLGIAKSLYQRLVDALVGRGEEQMVRPTGITEHDGRIYVADPGAPALWILDPARGHFAKVESAGDGPFVSPVAVAVRPDGAVFVADTGLKKVLMLDREGRFIRVAAQADLQRPAGLAYDPSTQRLYVVDSLLHRVLVYDGDGNLVRGWGRKGTGDGEFNYPTHVAIDATGTVLVTDALNFRIQAFDRDGRFLWKFGRHGDGSGDLSAPKGVGADSGGHVYVVDALFDAVQIFDRDGTLLLSFGEKGARAGQFGRPGGLFVSAQGRIFVADAYNHRVQIFIAVAGAETRP